MTLARLITYMIILFTLVGILIYLLVAGPSQADIQKEINTANFCGSTEDCGVVRNRCPFDCNTYVNVNEVNRINQLLKDFDADCTTRCDEAKGVSCVNNKCIAKKQ